MTDRETAPPAPPAPALRPLSIAVWAAWFGLTGGLLELAAFLARCLVFDPRNFNVSREFPWMFPAAGLAVAAPLGSLLALAVWAMPGRLGAKWAAGILAFPAVVGGLFRLPLSTAACLALGAGLAVRVGSWAGRHVEGFDRLARRGLVVSAAVVVALAVGVRVWPRGAIVAGAGVAGPSRATNVILIVLDTVRARSLSLYGYGRETSPELSRLAARGVRYDRAFSTAPWTAPSHASMFTGRWADEVSVGWGRPLDGAHPTLAGFLAGRGYDTAGFVANTTYCSYETGLDRGFQRYDDYDVTARSVLLCSALVRRGLTFAEKHPKLGRLVDAAMPSGVNRKDAARVSGDLLRWLDQGRADPSRPFFAFLNYYDAHHPYLPPGPEADGLLTPDESQMLRGWWGLDKRSLTPDQVALARDAYDRCIVSLDRQIGLLFDELGRRGLLEKTLVVITADHGEHLGENNLFGHGTSLYRPELHVPLVVIAPSNSRGGDAAERPRVVREPVSLRDIPATVVDHLGFSAVSPFPGRPLPNGDGRETDDSDRLVLSAVLAAPEDDPNKGGSPSARGALRSAVGWGHHYVVRSDGLEELFDLEADADERHNLVDTPGPSAATALARFRSTLRR